MPEMLESEIERWLVNAVKKAGGKAYKWVSPGNSGVPDRIVIMPNGVVVFTELKTAKGRLTKNQEVQINKLRSLGCDVRVVKGIEEAKRFIEEVSNGV